MSENELAKVVMLGSELHLKEADLALLEIQVENCKKRINAIQLQELPDAMNDVGLNSFTLSNGTRIDVKPFYQCSVSDTEPSLKAQALAWLEAEGVGSLIKHEFKCNLSKEASALAKELEAFLESKEIDYKDGQSINAATLKSFMKERIENGKSFPLEIFRGYYGKKAQITK